MTFLLAWVESHWRVVALAVALAVIGWWHQHEVTKAYRRGATDGERSTLAQAAAKVEADTDSRRRQYEVEQVRLDTLEAKIQGERAALIAARETISSTLTGSLNQIRGQEVVSRNEIQQTPDNALNGRFRDALSHARSSELSRTGAVLEPGPAEPGRDPRGNSQN